MCWRIFTTTKDIKYDERGEQSNEKYLDLISASALNGHWDETQIIEMSKGVAYFPVQNYKKAIHLAF